MSELSEIEIWPQAVWGWRFWEIRPDTAGEPQLCATSLRATPWPLQPQRAECLMESEPGHTHTPGDVECECGWHAYHTLSDCERAMAAQYGSNGPAVLGVVAGAGLVAVHQSGWRAERAEILGLVRTDADALITPPWLESLWRAQERVAELYRVPLYRSAEGARAVWEGLGGVEAVPADLKPYRELGDRSES